MIITNLKLILCLLNIGVSSSSLALIKPVAIYVKNIINEMLDARPIFSIAVGEYVNDKMNLLIYKEKINKVSKIKVLI